MLAICTDDNEAEVSGTANDLRGVRVAIISLLSSSELSASLPAVARDPGPYARSLAELIIRRSEGPTLVTATQTALVVAGSDDSLARFSSWFNLPSDVQQGYHSHFEPLAGDPYHSPESIPLVVAIGHAGA